MKKKVISILFVCTANICRSPIAQGIMANAIHRRGLSNLIKVESAGTHVSRQGVRPDPRAQDVSKRNGINIKKLKSRMIESSIFHSYDYIVGMDYQNIRTLEAACPQEHLGKIGLIMDYAPQFGLRELPDPYFGNISGFERVMEILEPACEGLLKHICQQHDVAC